MRIIFMGTPAFAVPSLTILVEHGYNVVAVVTAPDKPAGRGQKLQMSPVKEYALQKNIPLLQPVKLSDPAFIDELRGYKADLQIVVAFRMLPEVVWSMPPMGTFNLHGSLLPQYRGAAPIHHAVMNGEEVTGLTTFFLKHEIDTGNIILRREVPVGADETTGELHDRMMQIGAELLLETVRLIESGTVKTIPQSELSTAGKILYPAPKIFREHCKLDFSRSSEELFNQVRGLSPSPGAFFEYQEPGKDPVAIKVYRCRAVFAGTVLTHELFTDNKSYIRISAKDGFIEPLELQVPGKKRMTVKELLQGFRFDPGARIL
jgi:methionyl-tRNA formyltransferase